MRVFVAMLICSVMPGWAAAQVTPTLPKNDARVSIGWSGADHQHAEDGRWFGSLLASANAGHYWTDHWKTEVEAAWSSPGTREVYENIQRDGNYTYAIANYKADDVRIGVAQLYQFGRNQWVHPYVGIGADVVHRHAAVDRPAQVRTVYVRNGTIPVEIPASSERRTTVFAQAVLKTGLKMYVSEKTFFNTELKFVVRDEVDHVVWTIGLGRDF